MFLDALHIFSDLFTDSRIVVWSWSIVNGWMIWADFPERLWSWPSRSRGVLSYSMNCCSFFDLWLTAEIVSVLMRVQCSSLAFCRNTFGSWKYVFFFSETLTLPFIAVIAMASTFVLYNLKVWSIWPYACFQLCCVVAWSCLHPGESAACGRGILQAFRILGTGK